MELCNILKYDRSLYPSKAVFFYKTDDSDFVPLEADICRIRGPKSGFTEAFTPQFLPKNLSTQDLTHNNILTLEECYVPPNVDHLYCRFSLRVQANSLAPSGCSDPEVFSLLKEFAEVFKERGGYKELAVRYCRNILLGTWLWRNQNTGNTEIKIKTSSGNDYLINNTRKVAWESKWSDEELKTLEDLSNEIQNALIDPNVFWSADITAKIESVFCQEVYPSQILTDKVSQSEASKQFVKSKFSDGRYAVSFNSVKIGAALQSIDDWWDDGASKRLRVHEFGVDKEIGTTRRPPHSEHNFYHILKSAERYLSELNKFNANNGEVVNPNIYYLFSVLIKGGMFQKKAESKKG
ncbi:type I-F CRISPR-associated protein Csy3 [Psychromonas algicola]|uniref:type I-F CRISPR-associated protein Csy3 n=1 Tax=Psychromonas algicola TaxID=2555642 RepID=UPI0010686343|nr:type I-F CRISPR-associated protein Csy3 [Psychromonas sp. RZ5]TEW46141.1 type I-F CRISPR-associated protein Csy3 [Psychromonas sp. RZ5]